MPAKILHIFEDGIEKKRCSKCKRYLPLDKYIYAKDRWDKLKNECNYCRHIRNKRRHNEDYDIEEELFYEEKEKENCEPTDKEEK